MNGKVKEYDDELTIEGEYINGKINGKVKEYHEGGGTLIFEAEYINGKKNIIRKTKNQK